MEANMQKLQFKLAQVLQNNMQKKTRLASTGRLEPSRIAHYKTSKLLFTQPVPNTGKKYKCEFLLDVSWSMSGSRIQLAVKSLKELIKLFYWIIDFKITCFANGVYTMSALEFMSIEADKLRSSDYFEEKLCWGWALPRKIWWETYLVRTLEQQTERDFSWATALAAALWNAFISLDGEEGEKFVVLLTDGWDNMWSYNYIGNAPCSIYNSSTIKTFVNDWKEKWIEVLPIWINTRMTHLFDNSVECSNPQVLLEQSIEFIQKHFG